LLFVFVGLGCETEEVVVVDPPIEGVGCPSSITLPSVISSDTIFEAEEIIIDSTNVINQSVVKLRFSESITVNNALNIEALSTVEVLIIDCN